MAYIQIAKVLLNNFPWSINKKCACIHYCITSLRTHQNWFFLFTRTNFFSDRTIIFSYVNQCNSPIVMFSNRNPNNRIVWILSIFLIVAPKNNTSFPLSDIISKPIFQRFIYQGFLINYRIKNRFHMLISKFFIGKSKSNYTIPSNFL
jgi:hypothetical protein